MKSSTFASKAAHPFHLSHPRSSEVDQRSALVRMAQVEAQQHPDGPLDRRIDVSYLPDSVKLLRQKLYDRWKASGGSITTAAGQVLQFDLGREEENVKLSELHWKVDGQVSPSARCLRYLCHLQLFSYTGERGQDQLSEMCRDQ